MHRLRNAKQRGFTLISLLVALGVISITAAIGIPAFLEIMQEIQLKNAARETMAALRIARYRAINEAREFGVAALPGELPKVFSGNNPADASALISRIDLPATLTVQADFSGDKFVIFSPDGSAGSVGSFAVQNANLHVITVTVDPASTARIEVSKIQEITP